MYNFLKLDNEILTYLGTQKQEYDDFRIYLYNIFVDPKGWANVSAMHNNTLFKIRESIYRSMKFYNWTNDYYGSLSASFDGIHYAEISLFILNTLVCAGGIAGYVLINRGKLDLKNSCRTGEQC